jgi:hypothetical protein
MLLKFTILAKVLIQALPREKPPDLNKNYCVTPTKCAKINSFGWQVKIYKDKSYGTYATDSDTPSATIMVDNPHFGATETLLGSQSDSYFAARFYGDLLIHEGTYTFWS